MNKLLKNCVLIDLSSEDLDETIHSVDNTKPIILLSNNQPKYILNKIKNGGFQENYIADEKVKDDSLKIINQYRKTFEELAK